MYTTKYKILLLINQNKRLSEIAEELGVSQPTITFHLKSLETALGIKLYHNKNKYLCLTEAAKSLLPYIIQMLEQESTLIDKANQYKHFQLGSISIGASLAPSISILPELLANFTKTYEHLHISLEIASTQTIVEGIVKQKYDLGFISSSMPLPPYLISKHFALDQLVLVYSYSLKQRFSHQTAKQILASNNFIHHTESSSTRTAVDDYFKEQGIVIHSTITANSVAVIKELIKKEIGISILPISLIETEIQTQQLEFIPLKAPQLTKAIQLIYHKDIYLTQTLHEFIKYF